MLFVILIGCQLQDTKKTHGIIYLENRSKALNVNDSNKNDVIKILGKPQIKSFDDDDTWIYAERLLTKGKIHKLGKWSIGEQKGFRIYQKDTYDTERDKLIENSLLEMKLGKNDIVTDMNRDIFIIDELYEQQNIKEIENEVNDISHLGEDNDNFGEFEESEY